MQENDDTFATQRNELFISCTQTGFVDWGIARKRTMVVGFQWPSSKPSSRGPIDGMNKIRASLR
jgi:hypothetical protein